MTDRKCFVFKFADVEVREREFLLIKAGEQIAVEPKAFRVLLFLLQNPGRLVTKDEIVASVWKDNVVSDNSLTRAVAQLRRVLGDDTRQPLYILTVPTIGYRFLCEVSATEDGFDTSPRLETNANDGRSHPDQGALQGLLAELPATPNRDSMRPRLILIAGLTVALLALVTLALIWHTVGKKAGHDGNAADYLLMERRVTSNPSEDPIQSAAVSPDNKYLAYSDPTGLYLRELSTGDTRPWSLPAGFVARPNSWFPDSTHLLAVRVEGPPQMPDLQKWSLYKLSLLGGPPEKIMDNAAAGSVSPDGTRIAYLPGPHFGSELWVMNADGSNTRRLTRAGILKKPGIHQSWIRFPAWSPGGQLVAYFESHGDFISNANQPAGSLMTIDANGSNVREVLNDSRVGDALWWAPDGRILFAYLEDPSSQKQDYGVYSIRLDRTGRAAETPHLITRAEGMIASLNSTADGKRLFLLRAKEPNEVFLTKFDARASHFQQPRRLTLDENNNYATAWTADSKAVLFISNRNGVWCLFKQGIDEITPEILAEPPDIDLPRLSPDGSEVLYLAASHPRLTSSPDSVMGKPLAGGPPHLVIREEEILNFSCARAPSQRCVLSKIDGQDFVFISFELKNGANNQEILRMKTNDFGNWVLSPDGSKLAIVCDVHQIRFFSLEDGTAHNVSVKDWPLYSVDWSADGRTVFMPSVTADGTPVILEVDQSGKARVVLQGGADSGFSAMIQSPDGQYGLLTEWMQAGNVWMVENF